jgi:hypothetical protein
MDSPHLGRSPSLPRRANGEVGSDANGVQDEVISPRLQELHEQLQVHIQVVFRIRMRMRVGQFKLLLSFGWLPLFQSVSWKGDGRL